MRRVVAMGVAARLAVLERYRQAEAGGVRFSANPYQPYYARVGWRCALVGFFFRCTDPGIIRVWSATIYSCDARGRCTPLVQCHFEGDQSAAFGWAADRLQTTEEL
jgi:hypothetical protein